jgi:hypothetical protein
MSKAILAFRSRGHLRDDGQRIPTPEELGATHSPTCANCERGGHPDFCIYDWPPLPTDEDLDRMDREFREAFGPILDWPMLPEVQPGATAPLVESRALHSASFLDAPPAAGPGGLRFSQIAWPEVVVGLAYLGLMLYLASGLWRGWGTP